MKIDDTPFYAADPLEPPQGPPDDPTLRTTALYTQLLESIGVTSQSGRCEERRSSHNTLFPTKQCISDLTIYLLSLSLLLQGRPCEDHDVHQPLSVCSRGVRGLLWKLLHIHSASLPPRHGEFGCVRVSCVCE